MIAYEYSTGMGNFLWDTGSEAQGWYANACRGGVEEDGGLTVRWRWRPGFLDNATARRMAALMKALAAGTLTNQVEGCNKQPGGLGYGRANARTRYCRHAHILLTHEAGEDATTQGFDREVPHA